MKKLGIILDSVAFYSEKECAAAGFAYLPQSVTIDGTLYADGVDILMKNAIEKMRDASRITSASPAAADIEKLFTKMAATFSHTVYFAMPKAISSTYQIAKQLATKFPSITVLDTKLVGNAIIAAAHFMRDKVEAGELTISAAIDVINKTASNSWCWIIPRDSSGFIKSGRLVGVKRLLLEKAKVVPRLLLTDVKIEVKALARNFVKSIRTALDDTVKKIGGVAAAVAKFEFQGIYCGETSSHAALAAAFKDVGINSVITLASTVIAVHAGIGAVGILAWPKFK